MSVPEVYPEMILATWTGVAVSDNRRLMHTRGRMIPNPAYISFKEGMAWEIQGGNPHQCCFHGRVSLTLRVTLPKRMDTMAVIKAACDAGQLALCYLDDNQIDRILVIREGNAKGKTSTIVFEIDEIATEI
jgi:Holliday junction resolvase RusA-like endonuclease